MGFFSDLFGENDSAREAALINAQTKQWELSQQQQAQAKADADAAAEAARLAGVRTSATEQARQSAQRYFSNMGVDPARYSGDIESQLQDLLGTVNPNDPTPGLYLKNLGEQTFSNLQNAAKERAGRDVNLAFAPDYENQRITNTLDDPILSDINAAQRGDADKYIQNLLSRHVITEPGAAGARAKLDEQAPAVQSQLENIGSDVLAEGRGKLSDILGRARGAAGNIVLGQDYSTAPYQSELDQAYNDFVSGLGTNIKGQLGSAPLYDTSGLAAAAGAASGAQNTRFDPNALAGIYDENAPEAPLGTTPRKRSVF